MGIFVCFKFIA